MLARWTVDENGAVDSRTDDDFDELDEYTPNYVSTVRIFDDGAYVYVDTKSMFFPAMARTMIRVIIAEAEKLGAAVRIGDPYAEDYYTQGVDYADALPPQ
jgi:myosin-crossreactive antigen